MQIKKKINKKLFIAKLNAMFDYAIELQINQKLNNIILSDRHGQEVFYCEDITRDNFEPITINHRIDRRELVRKLKSMTELYINIVFDDINHTITLQGITLKETSIYYCELDTALTKEQTFGIFNWFK